MLLSHTASKRTYINHPFTVLCYCSLTSRGYYRNNLSTCSICTLSKTLFATELAIHLPHPQPKKKGGLLMRPNRQPRSTHCFLHTTHTRSLDRHATHTTHTLVTTAPYATHRHTHTHDTKHARHTHMLTPLHAARRRTGSQCSRKLKGVSSG